MRRLAWQDPAYRRTSGRSLHPSGQRFGIDLHTVADLRQITETDASALSDDTAHGLAEPTEESESPQPRGDREPVAVFRRVEICGFPESPE
jgi:hypothetical protein